MVIQNFNVLSSEELQKFAEELIKTINTEHTFTDNGSLQLDKDNSIEASEFDGNLWIPVYIEDFVVERPAEWTCSDYEDRYDAKDPDFTNYFTEDAEKSFKELSVIVGDYKVTIEVTDGDEGETVDVVVNSYTEEDSGIGSYEFWGHTGYDSHPYLTIDGDIHQACTCYMGLIVEPVNN